jgi:hypothetical protein
MSKDPFEKQIEDARSERDNDTISDQSHQNNQSAEIEPDSTSNRNFWPTMPDEDDLSEAQNKPISPFPFVKLSLGAIGIYFGLYALYGQPIFSVIWIFVLVVGLGLMNSYFRPAS